MKSSTFKKLLSMRDALQTFLTETDEDRHKLRDTFQETVGEEFEKIREEGLEPLCAYKMTEKIPYPNPDSEGNRIVESWAPICSFDDKDLAVSPHDQNGRSRGIVTRSKNKILEAASCCAPEAIGPAKREMMSGFVHDILDIISEECCWDSTKAAAVLSEKAKVDRYLSAFESAGR